MAPAEGRSNVCDEFKAPSIGAKSYAYAVIWVDWAGSCVGRCTIYKNILFSCLRFGELSAGLLPCRLRSPLKKDIESTVFAAFNRAGKNWESYLWGGLHFFPILILRLNVCGGGGYAGKLPLNNVKNAFSEFGLFRSTTALGSLFVGSFWNPIFASYILVMTYSVTSLDWLSSINTWTFWLHVDLTLSIEQKTVPLKQSFVIQGLFRKTFQFNNFCGL